jgi:hypothetical protein
MMQLASLWCQATRTLQMRPATFHYLQLLSWNCSPKAPFNYVVSIFYIQACNNQNFIFHRLFNRFNIFAVIKSRKIWCVKNTDLMTNKEDYKGIKDTLNMRVRQKELREGPQDCETSGLPHFLDNRLTDGGRPDGRGSDSRWGH